MERPPADSQSKTPAQAISDDDTVAVRIDALAPGGDAVGRQQGGMADGRATFVPLAAPGERIRARLTRQKGRVAWAELVSVTEPSTQRVAPRCPLFGHCGGCQWQHVDLAEQRRAKQAIVARALGLSEVPLIVPTMASIMVSTEDGFGYRDRAQLVVGDRGALGFRARRSHDVIDVPACPLLSAPLSLALAAIRSCMAELPAGTEVHLQSGREGVHVALRWPRAGGTVASGPVMDRWQRLWQAWRGMGIVGLRIIGAGGGREAVWGEADVDIGGGELDAAPLRVPAGGFAQVGRMANAALVAAVSEAVGDAPGRVLELYAGSGNFTRALITRSPRVTANDLDARAVIRGRANVPSAVWIDRPPLSVDADTVVVDPPREGLDAVNLRAALQARRLLVYVSCDPQTLRRDAARLAEGGFQLCGAVALDLMPHTFHVEVVARFARISEGAPGDEPPV